MTRKGQPSRAPTDRECHYCFGKASSWDHVVPHSTLVKHRIILRSEYPNCVPACGRCNQVKARDRTDCTCFTCVNAWTVYGPAGWSESKIIELQAHRVENGVLTRFVRSDYEDFQRRRRARQLISDREDSGTTEEVV